MRRREGLTTDNKKGGGRERWVQSKERISRRRKGRKEDNSGAGQGRERREKGILSDVRANDLDRRRLLQGGDESISGGKRIGIPGGRGE